MSAMQAQNIDLGTLRFYHGSLNKTSPGNGQDIVSNIN